MEDSREGAYKWATFLLKWREFLDHEAEEIKKAEKILAEYLSDLDTTEKPVTVNYNSYSSPGTLSNIDMIHLLRQE